MSSDPGFGLTWCGDRTGGTRDAGYVVWLKGRSDPCASGLPDVPSADRDFT